MIIDEYGGSNKTQIHAYKLYLNNLMNKDLFYSVILFLSANHAVRAESVLLKKGLHCKMIPIPRNISSDCGVGVRIYTVDKENVVKTLSNLNIKIVKIEDM